MIKLGLPIPFDGHAIAANNLPLLRQLPDSGVPMVVIDGESVDGNSDWLDRLPVLITDPSPSRTKSVS